MLAEFTNNAAAGPTLGSIVAFGVSRLRSQDQMATACEVGGLFPVSAEQEFPSDFGLASAVQVCLHPRRTFPLILRLD